MLTPARLPKRSPRRLRKFYAMIVKVFTLARVAKLADARDLKHDSALLSGIANLCKRLQKKGVSHGRLQANTSHSRQVLATFSATVIFPVEVSGM